MLHRAALVNEWKLSQQQAIKFLKFCKEGLFSSVTSAWFSSMWGEWAARRPWAWVLLPLLRSMGFLQIVPILRIDGSFLFLPRQTFSRGVLSLSPTYLPQRFCESFWPTSRKDNEESFKFTPYNIAKRKKVFSAELKTTKEALEQKARTVQLAGIARDKYKTESPSDKRRVPTSGH